MPFVKDEWTRFVAERLLITLLNTLCASRHVVMGCGSVFFKSRQVVQPGSALWVAFSSAPTLKISAAFLQLQGLPEQHSCDHSHRHPTRPGTGLCVECMGSCSKDLHFFLSFLRLFFNCIHAKPFDKHKRFPPPHIHIPR